MCGLKQYFKSIDKRQYLHDKISPNFLQVPQKVFSNEITGCSSIAYSQKYSAQLIIKRINKATNN